MPLASTINALLQPAGQAKNKIGIIRITIRRGATIKVFISETERCTQRMKDFSLVKSYPEDLKIQSLAER
jgi:hypothetical protein